MQIIQDNLPEGILQDPLVLFSKQQHMTHWYYHIYYTTREQDIWPYHPILIEMFSRKKCPQGNLVIVKNRDNFAPDKSEFDVDINELAAGEILSWKQANDD
ncbi:hypothetical protein BD769DRAFT_1385335 [Suillus cothurnatus]|nr:hypothetical protein BD769DRAFT_1385335 [Suillus cothurnatus]